MRSRRRLFVLLGLAMLLLVVPVPYSGHRLIRDEGSGCATTDWNGVAPLPFALAAYAVDAPARFNYRSDQQDVCV